MSDFSDVKNIKKGLFKAMSSITNKINTSIKTGGAKEMPEIIKAINLLKSIYSDETIPHDPVAAREKTQEAIKILLTYVEENTSDINYEAMEYNANIIKTISSTINEYSKTDKLEDKGAVKVMDKEDANELFE